MVARTTTAVVGGRGGRSSAVRPAVLPAVLLLLAVVLLPWTGVYHRAGNSRGGIQLAAAQTDCPLIGQGIDPYTAGAVTEKPKMFLSVQLKKLIRVDEVMYSYAAYFQVVATWRDPRVNDTLAINNAINAFGPSLTGLATDNCKPNVSFSGFNISQKEDCLKNRKQNNLPQMDGCSKKCTPSGTMCCDSIWIPSLTIDNVLFYPQDRYQTESIYFFGQYSNEFSSVDREVVVGGEFSSPLDFKMFPLDTQTLRLSIQVESGEFYLVQSNSGRESEQGGGQLGGGGGTFVVDEVTGWKINSVALNCTPAATTVATTANYAPDDPWSAFSQSSSSSDAASSNQSTSCVFTIQVSRTSGVFIISIIVPVTLSVYLCFSVFFAKPDDLETRSATFLTLFLALAAVQFVIDGQLPRSSAITRFGYLVIISYVFIVLSAVETLIVYLISDRLEKDVVDVVGDVHEVVKRSLTQDYSDKQIPSPPKDKKLCMPCNNANGGEENEGLRKAEVEEAGDENGSAKEEETERPEAEMKSGKLTRIPTKHWKFSLFGYHLKPVKEEKENDGNYLLAVRIDFVCCVTFFFGYTLCVILLYTI
ncbi:hypothetical protein CLOM_g18119 [Closterium sp. NIES-68]|nr:hypothetical protein CLOM_g18119 [Closterium sp. NIES-68]GJP68260.1 hypothetical protein CLOP_g24984 [Closterium sp. NIES-67]